MEIDGIKKTAEGISRLEVSRGIFNPSITKFAVGGARLFVIKTVVDLWTSIYLSEFLFAQVYDI